MSAKAYQDKKALPLVEKLKEVVKNLTIKYVQLTEQSKKLTAKMDRQQKQISHLTDKVILGAVVAMPLFLWKMENESDIINFIDARD